MSDHKNGKKIVYIVSDVRSGSTLLENVLSKSEDIISVGELHNLGGYLRKDGCGSEWQWKCSCGSDVSECEFWREIVESSGQVGECVGLSTMIRERESNFGENDTVDVLDGIYGSIFNRYGGSIIVDSSKLPYQGIVLYRKSIFKVKLIYLKRDIRAVSLSKRKWRKKNNEEDVHILRELYRSFSYRKKCSEMLSGVPCDDLLEIKYEEFFHKSGEVFRRLEKFLDVGEIVKPEYMELIDDHTIGGTPNRFGRRKIELDESWKEDAKGNILFNAIGYIMNRIS